MVAQDLSSLEGNMPGIFQDSLSFIIKSFRLWRILCLQSGLGSSRYSLLPITLVSSTVGAPLPGCSVESQDVHPLRCVQSEENVVQRLTGRLDLSQEARVELEILSGGGSVTVPRLQVEVDSAGHGLLDSSLDVLHLVRPQQESGEMTSRHGSQSDPGSLVKVSLLRDLYNHGLPDFILLGEGSFPSEVGFGWNVLFVLTIIFTQAY